MSRPEAVEASTPVLFEVEQHDYRVLIAGPHVGMYGCGKVWFFDTLGEAEAAIEAAPTLCDAATYPVCDWACDGSCRVEVTIERFTWDPHAANGYGGAGRFLRSEVVGQVERPAKVGA